MQRLSADADVREELTRPFDRIEFLLQMQTWHKHLHRNSATDTGFLELFFSAVGIHAEFRSAALSMASDVLCYKIVKFTDDLLTDFFIPIKAVGGRIRTYLPTEIPPQQVEDPLVILRTDCLRRDRHRCVVTGGFDRDEARQRFRSFGDDGALDDDGEALKQRQKKQATFYASLEIAYILPPALINILAAEHCNLTNLMARQRALDVLLLFGDGLPRDLSAKAFTPANALTMTHDVHVEFCQYRLYFQQPDESAPSDLFYASAFDHERVAVLTERLERSLSISPADTAPDRRFLEAHCAIAHILHWSRAGDYIDRLLIDAASPWEVQERRVRTRDLQRARDSRAADSFGKRAGDENSDDLTVSAISQER
ncbi:hypothetical protein SCUCBS95973_006058 [Sporothrix curviconia]|uniref:HNH nuclease domain-containing protein n=1 Tax=Sporothrix curviconia TaxID=1260050 RepID=A0ABP0C211_9PEZI